MRRNDPHSVGNIRPADYSFVIYYALATTVDGWPQPSLNIDSVLELQKTKQFARHGSVGKCSVCGTSYIYGEIWRHDPTGEHIHVGHVCARKYGLLADSTALDQWKAEQRAHRAQDLIRAERQQQREWFLSQHPGLSDDLAMEHPILRDMSDRLSKGVMLTDKQIAFAHKLAEEIRNPPPPEQHVPAPTGRITFTGVCLNTKSVCTYYGGTTLKMLLKIDVDGGSWLCYCSVPNALLDANCSGERGPLQGQTITIKATLSRGRDAHFAFGSRPVWIKS